MTNRNFDSPLALRKAIRSRQFCDFTNLACRDFVQGNLMVVPKAQADDFSEFCRLNPAALPVLGATRTGEWSMPGLAMDLDLRTDVGTYMVFRDGLLCATPNDVLSEWRDDLVAFVLGCSFSFERILERAGIYLRHLDEGSVSAMYVTNRQTTPAGVFGGPLVVSMRAIREEDVAKAIEVSSRLPMFHGAPIHVGDPAALGVDLDKPYGGHGLTRLHSSEIPVFWACGATAQLAALEAKLSVCITHYKAHMVVTDLAIDESMLMACEQSRLQ